MTDIVLHLLREALVLAVLLSAPPLLAAWLSQVVVAAGQRAAGIPEAPGMAHGPRLAVVALAMVAAGPWSVDQLVNFARIVFASIATVGGA